MLKRKIPLFITFFVGLIFIVKIFIPHKPFNEIEEFFSICFDIIACFAFVLGGGSLLKIHLAKIQKKKEGWGYSTVTVLSFIIVLLLSLIKFRNPSGFYTSAVDEAGGFLHWIYTYMLSPLSSTMFSLLAFYVASASYRAFRAKNVEATILLVSAFIILVGRTFMGVLLTAWLPQSLSFLTIPELAGWTMSVPLLAGQRAIMIGVSLGVISMSLKMILGIERSYMGGGEE